MSAQELMDGLVALVTANEKAASDHKAALIANGWPEWYAESRRIEMTASTAWVRKRERIQRERRMELEMVPPRIREDR